jgi:hypothetical protein
MSRQPSVRRAFLLLLLACLAPPPAAQDCGVVALTPVGELFDAGTPEGADSIELELQARAGEPISVLDDLEPEQPAAVQELLALVGGDESILGSGYRPLPYQQHFFDLSTAFKELKKLPGVGAAKGDAPQLQVKSPAAFAKLAEAALYEAQICALNLEIALHGLQKGKKGGLAVNAPEESAHTSMPALAIDISTKALKQLGFAGSGVDAAACAAGLWRPYGAADKVHFELVPGPDDPHMVAFDALVVEGDGAVALDPPGGKYLPGCLVAVTASPASGFELSGKGSLKKSPTTYQVGKKAKTVTVGFKPITAKDGTVTVIVVGPGVVTSPDGMIECPFGACSATYPQNAYPFLQAWPDEGHVFVGWDLADCFTELCPLVPSDFKDGLVITALFE